MALAEATDIAHALSSLHRNAGQDALSNVARLLGNRCGVGVYIPRFRVPINTPSCWNSLAIFLPEQIEGIDPYLKDLGKDRYTLEQRCGERTLYDGTTPLFVAREIGGRSDRRLEKDGYSLVCDSAYGWSLDRVSCAIKNSPRTFQQADQSSQAIGMLLHNILKGKR